MSYVLAVETSCDDTSVALVKENGFVISNTVINQNSIHKPYGGVVPELASRNHTSHLLPLIEEVFTQSQIKWEDVVGFSVTNRPGLIGSLIVGLITVKTLALLLKKPYIGVNHIEGHLLSPFLWDSQHSYSLNLKFPYLALIISGSHSHLFEVKNYGHYILVGKTLDDAAGEALDKFARALNLSYPSGAQVDKEAQACKNLGTFSFPKTTFKHGGLNFSFSGLKTAATKLIHNMNLQDRQKHISNLCADYQEILVDQLIDRLDQAINIFSFERVVIAGGVSANSRLRKKAKDWAVQKGVHVILPALSYCTDNAAMIAKVGWRFLSRKEYSPQNLNCSPYSYPSDFIT